MYYIGTSLVIKRFANSAGRPAILAGYSKYGAPIVHMLDVTGALEKGYQTFLVDLSYLRVPDKSSPSGYSIYKGPFVKHGFIKNGVILKLKVSDDELTEYLTTFQEKIKNEGL